MAYEQDKRVGEVTIAGGEKLVLVRFSGTEAISEPFVFHVEALSETNGSVDFDKAIGRNATVAVRTTADDRRYFVGLLTETTGGDATDEGYVYGLVLRPWLHLLKKRINSRIFNNKTVNEILSDVFGPYGQPFEDRTERRYPQLEYCVQYRESDFDFVSRLMEAHGISYHFGFEKDRQALILADTGREDMPGKMGAEREVVPGEQQLRDKETLFSWTASRAFTTGKTLSNDYDFEHPNQNYESESVENAPKYEHPDLEDYAPLYHQHLGKNISSSFGKDYSKYRLEGHRSQDNHFAATGDAPGLTPGFRMRLAGLGGDFIVVRATHSLSMQAYRSGAADAPIYTGSYEFYPDKPDAPYAPPMRTPKPVVGGLQTALVVTEKTGGTEEIDVDKYGRVVVRFHWEKRKDDERSMRVRVAQMWAGNLWGTIYIPRVGMEVVVAFLDGDPDRPLVVGSVYNADNMPPYKQDDATQKNISGVKSRSTKGGGGYNEFVFDDTAGKEVVRMHAQKDHETLILNNEKREIKSNRVTTVSVDETLTVDGNILIEAKATLTLKVGLSTIKMTPGSISIESPMISVDAKANLETRGAAIANHSAGGPMMITGAVIKIN